jgi:hypothetical protein
MITRGQIIPFLLERCPEFAPVWKEHQNGINADIGPYIDVGEFVHFILNSYEQGNLELMPRAFQAVEDLLAEGDSSVQEIAALGILETLQCAASWKPYGNKAFLQWLGPKSRAEWDELVEIWRGKSSLADVVRAEQKQKRN